MNRLSLSQLDQQADKYNTSVAGSPGIDPFCCRTDWIIPFNYAFTPRSRIFIRQRNDSYIILAERELSDKKILTSAESMWGFSSPLVGSESTEMFAALINSECRYPDIRHSRLILFGLPDDPRIIRPVLESSLLSHHPFLMKPALRSVISLEKGLDGFWERRSRKFRANIEQWLSFLRC